ncbi:efflux RND transporter permease subunit [Bacteroides mediterraneensis]|uniref:efflux RND transporter permease subunit n=1 Tax=Bacteroides mediterraneensis TaxID=1841856 RepID=UPI0009335C4C|nr:multidrug efflux RND transporter permease subunit [Bacteroides mediterraneensis]
MKVSFFIDRPVFSAVISILIVIVGIIGLMMLPIDQYPQITPPVVKISASYPGASAVTVSQAVATPIEQELNGTPGMLYMESSSSNSGGFSATVTFDISADPDLAAVEIQNRIKLAESRLPAEVIQNGISVEKQAPSQLMTLCLTSNDPKFDEIYLSNFATLNVQDLLRRIPGVGRISNIGSRYYAMQIWVDPAKLANFGLTVQDVQNALKDQNRESAAGVLGQQPVDGVDITIPITAQGRLSSASQFEEIVLRANPDGSLIRMRDVARVSLEASSYSTESGINGGNAAILAIYMLPGANAMEVAQNVKEAMKEISKSFPEGMEYNFPFDMTNYISESIHEVYKTLFEALFLVIVVVFLSLQNWRATLIPVVAVPISLIGTFGFMLIFGFSLNILTLLGLVLAIGIVVDDAIVVVENVERIMDEEKLSPYEATKKAMEGLVGAIIATSLVLAAVFVPVSFLSGITGQLYRQFTVTIVVSVLLSTVVALTLSPVMCSLILRPVDPNKPKNRVFRFINQWLAIGNNKYIIYIKRVIKNPRRVMVGFGMVLIFIYVFHRLVPTSFLPVEDQGYFTVELELPETATLERTRTVTDRAVDFIMKDPAVEYVQNVTGSSPRVGTSQARSQLTVILKEWKERDNTTIDEVMDRIQKELETYPESKVYLSTPPVIPGLGTAGGFEMQLEARGDATYDDLVRATDTLMYYASQRKEIAGLSSSLQAEIPQLYFDVDRDKVKLSGVPMADVFSTMKAYTGSVYVNDFNMFNRIYRVYIQAEAPYRRERDNIGLFFVRGSDGNMIPLTALGNTDYTTGPGSIKRFNMFNTSVIRGTTANGASSGQVMELLEQIAREKLPENIGVEWSGLSYQEKQAGGQTGLILALVFLFVFLFLAALYESWTVPIAVLISLPVAVLGAYAGITLCGLENDTYFQIGLVMLIGLAAKNAILIVEFAKDEVDKGRDIVESALHAASLRFRPILMTSLAFILGMLPMVLATGPGSASRQAIGTGVFFGMIVAVTVGILLVPFFFVMIYKATHKMKVKK